MNTRLGLGLLTMGMVGVLVAAAVSSQPSSASAQLRLTAAGDYGARAATDTVLAQVRESAPDAHLALGDLGYGDVPTEADWCSYVVSKVGRSLPFQPIAGNHDTLDGADGEIDKYSACLPNRIPGATGTYGREYYFDLPAGASPPLVRVIQVSPRLLFDEGRWTYAEGTDHHAWLAAAIDGARAEGVTWVVVSAHIPCWSVGIYECPATRDFYDLVASKRVDLVLHGHEHAYMRTKQLRSAVPGCPRIPAGSFDPDCVADADNSYRAGRGTVFATVGTGGIQLRDVSASDSEAGYFAAFQGANRSPAFGLLQIDVTRTSLAADFVPTFGSFRDSFAITMPGAAPPPDDAQPSGDPTPTATPASPAAPAVPTAEPPATASGPGVAGRPGKVRRLRVRTRGPHRVLARWLRPSDGGGSPIRGYRVRVSDAGGDSFRAWTTVRKRHKAFRKIRPRSKHVVQIRAVNAEGAGKKVTKSFRIKRR